MPDTCGPLDSGVAQPDVVIASDLPLQGPQAAAPRAMTDAIRLVLKQHDHRAGKFTVGYRSCDDSTAQTGNWELRRCAANAIAYAAVKNLMAMIGPWSSYCAQRQLPILNRARGGAVPVISPTNTDAGLTRTTGVQPPDAWRNEPDVYYPTGKRNYVRLLGTDDLHGGAQAIVARRLGLRRVFVLDDGSFFRYLLADPFRRAAKRLGVPVIGSATYDPRAKRYDALIDRIARSDADGVVLAGVPWDGGGEIVKALRARMGKRLTIMGSFEFAFARDVLKLLGPAAHGIYVSTGDVPHSVRPLSAAGRRFARELGDASNQYGVLEAAQATEVVLDAIAKSDGTRASMIRQMRATKVKNGILGTFGFDRNGDVTPAEMVVVRITGSTPPEANLPPYLQGAVVDQIVRVPPELVR
jgi:branched-chain amino acid transport system substrate-binding protein